MIGGILRDAAAMIVFVQVRKRDKIKWRLNLAQCSIRKQWCMHVLRSEILPVAVCVACVVPRFPQTHLVCVLIASARRYDCLSWFAQTIGGYHRRHSQGSNVAVVQQLWSIPSTTASLGPMRVGIKAVAGYLFETCQRLEQSEANWCGIYMDGTTLQTHQS